MAHGRKIGGRTKGSLNRRTLEVMRRLEGLNCDPIEGMAAIATNESVSPEIRGRMYAELAHYLYPKRKPLDAPIALPLHGSFIEQGRACLQAVAEGRISIEQGAKLISAISGLVKVQELDKLECRLTKLEERIRHEHQGTTR